MSNLTTAPAPPPVVTEANPYVGPRTFREEEGERFFGRPREADDLYSLVLSEQVVLFYAQSGAGKSSLVNARLRPALREAGFRLLPTARVSSALSATGGPVTSNVFILNLLLWLDENRHPAIALEGQTLAHYLASEQWITLPIKLDEAMDEDEDEPPTTPVASPILLVIDQFEELFTTQPDKWEQREGFFRQLRATLQAAPHLHLLLVMREDFVASLDPYTRLLPGRLRARYAMERMGKEAAEAAVASPVADTSRPFAPRVAAQLVDNLRQLRLQGQTEAALGQYVEPVQLQVVCYQLWENLRNRPPGPIQATDLQDAGNVDRALADYYEKSIAAVLPPASTHNEHAAPNFERQLRLWFDEELITPVGTRGFVLQGAATTGGLPNSAVEILENERFLLRRETRAGGVWYELIHDRFVEPIQAANRDWFARNQNPLTQAAQAWWDDGRPSDQLYRDRQLAAAVTELEGNRDQYGEKEEKFVRAGQAAEQRRKTQRERLLTAVAILAFCLLAGLTTWALWSADRAQRSAESAATEQAKAQTEAQAAANAKALAEQKAVAAATAEAGAIVAKGESERLRQDARANLLTTLGVTLYDQFPQRSLLLAVEGINAQRAASMTVSTSAQTNMRDLLARTKNSRPLAGQEGVVAAVAFSADGHWLASANYDKTIRLWSLQDLGQAPQVLKGHEDVVRSVAFSPDGQWLASASSDNTIRLWPLKDLRQAPQVLKGHEGTVYSVAFSPDGQWLASAGSDKTIRLWSLQDLRQAPQVLKGSENSFLSVAFSGDGQWLATASGDKTIRLWSLQDLGQAPQVLKGLDDYVYSVAFSPDGQWLATASADKTVRLWSLKDLRKAPQVLKGHEGDVLSVAFSGDGQWLASASNDKTIRLWPLKDLSQAPQVLKGHESSVLSLAFSGDGQWLASASSDTTIRLWPLQDLRQTPQVLKGHASYVNAVAFSPDEQWLASASADNIIRLWPLQDLSKAPQVLKGHESYVNAVAFSADRQWLASASSDKTVRLWPLQDLRQAPQVLKGHTDVILSVAFSPDGQWLASASADKTIRMWPLQNLRQAPQVLKGHAGIVQSVAFSPDGQWLASASSDNTIWLWPLQDLRQVPQVLKGHADIVRSVAFSPDGQWLASASSDTTIRLWPLQDLRQAPQVLKGHTSYVSAVAFSPDGQWLASASADNTIRLWPLQDLRQVPQVLKGHTSAVSSVAFSPGGQLLASASNDFTIRLWPVAGEQLARLACQIAGRNFSLVEWTQYFGTDTYTKSCPTLPLHPSFLAAGAELAAAGNITEAIPIYQRALTLDNTLHFTPAIQARLDASQLLAGRDQLEQALVLLEQAHKLDASPSFAGLSDLTKLYQRNGARLAASGNITDAIPLYQKALALDATLPLTPAIQIHLDYGRALASKGEVENALVQLEKAYKLDSSPSFAGLNDLTKLYQRKAGSLAATGNITAAIPIYQRAVKLDATLPLTPAIQARLDYGRALADKGELEQAIVQLEQARQLDPAPSFAGLNDLTKLYQRKAAGLAATGNITDAIPLYQQALTLDATLSLTPAIQARVDYGRALVNNNETEQAIMQLEQARTLDPTPSFAGLNDLTKLYQRKGASLAVGGNITDAITIYQKALTLDAKLPLTPTVQARLDYGRALVNIGELEQAIAQLEQARKLDVSSSFAGLSDLTTAYQRKALSLAATGNITKAIPFYQQALILDATLHFTPVAQARLDYGRALADKGELEQAIAQLEQARQLDPTPSFAGRSDLTKFYQRKALNLAATGNITEAIPFYQKTLMLDTTLHFTPAAQARLDYGRALADQGNVEQAITQLEQARQLDPSPNFVGLSDLTRIYQGKAVKLAASGDITAAIPFYQQVLTVDVTQHFTSAAQARLDYGRALADKGEVEQAIAQLEQARTLDPTPSFAGLSDLIRLYQGKAKSLAVSGNITAAIPLYQKAVKLDVTLLSPAVQARLDYGRALANQGDNDEAIAQLEQAYTLDSSPSFAGLDDLTRLYQSKAKSLAVSGNITAAIPLYQKAVKLDATLHFTPAIQARLDYGRALADNRKVEQAIAQLEQVRDLDPSPNFAGLSDLTRLYQSQGASLAATGHITAAIPLYQKALTLDATLHFTPEVQARHDYGQALASQGKDLAATGNLTDALPLYQRALTLDATLHLTPEVQVRLDYGRALLYNDDNDGAIAQLEQAHKLDPTPGFAGLSDLTRLYQSKAKSLAATGNLTAAIPFYQRALTLDETLHLTPSVQVHLDYGRALVNKGDSDGAIAQLEQAYTLNASSRFDGLSDLTNLYQTKGASLAVTGNITDAIPLYQRALMLDTTLHLTPEIQVRLDYGRALANQGDNDGAIVQLEQARKLDPTPSFAGLSDLTNFYQNKGADLAATGNITDAIALYRRALNLNATLRLIPEAKARLDYGRALMSKGEVEQALALLEQAHTLDPSPSFAGLSDLAKLYQRKGASLAITGNLTDAIPLYLKALTLDTTLHFTPAIQVRLDVGKLLVDKGDLAQAISQYVSLGREQFTKGEYSQAMPAFNAAQAISATYNITAVLTANEWSVLCRNEIWAAPEAYVPLISTIALMGSTVQFLPACERAVADRQKLDGLVLEYRGIARTLSGDGQGALEDFNAVVQWAKQNGVAEAFILRRQAWIADIQANKNPFDPAILAELQHENSIPMKTSSPRATPTPVVASPLVISPLFISPLATPTPHQ